MWEEPVLLFVGFFAFAISIAYGGVSDCAPKARSGKGGPPSRGPKRSLSCS